MFKQGIICGVMLFAASTPYAGTFYDCHADKDGSCQQPRFGLGLTGLYLQPSSSSLVGSSDRKPWVWAGGIEGSYYFKDKKDLTANWLHYNLHYNRDRDSSEFEPVPFRVNNPLNIINVELGQSFDLSSRSTIRLSGGLQYLNANVNTIYATGNYFNDKYRGIGPRVGLNADYKINESFSVFANSAASILLGRSTRSTNLGGSSGPIRHDIAIPELEAKLGVSYNKPMKQGMVSVSAGWTVVNYFNLVGEKRADLTLSGPFLAARWRG